MDKMFYPDSVAVVGASANPDNMGRNIVQNLVTWEFAGRVYPVNPRGEDVLGLKGYTSLEEVPGRLTWWLLSCRPGWCPASWTSARGRASADGDTSGGFSEFGARRQRSRQARCSQKAEEYGIRFVGPNGLTIINAENGLCLPFLPIRKREPGSDLHYHPERRGGHEPHHVPGQRRAPASTSSSRSETS